MKRVTSGWWLVASKTLQCWALRKFHGLVCRADDWCFAQERKMQVASGECLVASDTAYDPQASRVRERAVRKTRLRYTGGQFVRTSH